MSSRSRLAAVLLLGAAAGCGSGPPRSVDGGLSIEPADTQAVVRWITAHRGTPVLVNFWATWCGPCVAEMPDLLAGTREFRAHGGLVLGVAMEQMGVDSTVDEAVAKVQKRAPELGIDFPVLVCTDDDIMVVRKVLAIELGGLPQTLAYDRRGTMVQQHEGRASLAQFAAFGQAAER